MMVGRHLRWRTCVLGFALVIAGACSGTRVEASVGPGTAETTASGDASALGGSPGTDGSADPADPLSESAREDAAAAEAARLDAFGVVAVLVEGAQGFERRCTGVVVGPTTVVTAGHCVAPLASGPIRVEAPDGTTYPVDVKHLHPGYENSAREMRNDYAILTTAAELPVSRIGLGKDSRSPYVGSATVLSVRGDGEHPSVATIAVVAGDNSHCLPPGPPVMFDPSLMLCLSASDGGFCDGDSGSPVLADGPDGSRALVGILMATGDGDCADRAFPGAMAGATTGAGGQWLRRQLGPT